MRKLKLYQKCKIPDIRAGYKREYRTYTYEGISTKTTVKSISKLSNNTTYLYIHNVAQYIFYDVIHIILFTTLSPIGSSA